LPATRGLALKLRPTFRFPTGLAPLVRRAAIAGGITLAAQQLATAVMLRVANGGSPGTLVVLTIAQTVYLVPWAVLAVPVATAMFPRLSAARESGDIATATQVAGSGLRLVAALAAIGTAGLVAAATPIANVLQDKHQDGHSVFAPAIAALAVGLIGWSVVALLARVLYAARRPQFAAIGQAIGWLVTITVDVIIALEVSRAHRAVALGLANALGVTVAAGALLVIAVRMGTLGPSTWLVRSLGGAIAAAGLGSAAGWTVSRSVTSTGVAASLAIGLAAAIVGVAVAAIVVVGIDRSIVSVIRPRVSP
jgi:putative peptidoglycan lipid II flippase